MKITEKDVDIANDAARAAKMELLKAEDEAKLIVDKLRKKYNKVNSEFERLRYSFRVQEESSSDEDKFVVIRREHNYCDKYFLLDKEIVDGSKLTIKLGKDELKAVAIIQSCYHHGAGGMSESYSIDDLFFNVIMNDEPVTIKYTDGQKAKWR